MPENTDAYVNVAIPPAGADYGPVFDPREVNETRPQELRPARRRYTVRRWDAQLRQLTLDFVVHGSSGAAGPWAAAAHPGDVLVFNGPGSTYRPATGAGWYLFVGDESALPAIASSVESLADGVNAVVRMVCDGAQHELALDSQADVDLQWLHRTKTDPAPLIRAVKTLSFPPGSVDVFLHGEAEEIREIRRHLIIERGLCADAMSCSPYWRRGMSDERWRSVKKEFVTQMNRETAQDPAKAGPGPRAGV